MAHIRNALDRSPASERRTDRRRVVIMDREKKLIYPLLCRNWLDGFDHHRSIATTAIGRHNCIAEVSTSLSQRIRQKIPKLNHANRLPIHIEKPDSLRHAVSVLNLLTME